MTAIFDHLRATIVAAVVILIALAMQMQAREANVEQTSVYVGKQQSLGFARWLEDDMMRLGTYLDSVDVYFDPPLEVGDNTVLFAFYRDSLDLSTSPVDTITVQTRYLLDSTRTEVVADSTYQLFELQREVRLLDDGVWTTWSADGVSPDNLSFFRIELLDVQGQVVTTEPETAFIRVAFSMIPPYQSNSQYLNELNWGTTFNMRAY
jgi:hypothetical protein